ncbi:probable E3 ubiquitin-protein ligase EDA40 [Abrus precatorius]|uniref:Probable E3 ubiquitin-protein ligase EDA40 n=1 Tax=Abrus precatorius TaxID=3816 RepID=A0A8B8KSZ7_ABRPR|nr:probable E3 ubiquitin-protein ligase EDA40 [Abrus precatorius]
MVYGWRKTFNTSKTMPENREPDNHAIATIPSRPLRCRTSLSNSPLSNSPRQQCNNARTPSPNKRKSPTSFPSSPNSPSTFSLLKATLRLSKNLCGICTQSGKTGEGKAIFTAECSHIFHFPCIAAHVKKQQMLTCPVCRTTWKELQNVDENRAQHVKTTNSLKPHIYNDDEPLMSPTSISRFNPIPESVENEEEEGDDELNGEQTGFNLSSSLKTRNIDACFSPEAAIVASNRSAETYVAVLKVKAPPRNAAVNRPPVDLVTVLDVGVTASGEELRMLKHSMQAVISSLGSADRLSVVAFSGGSKRLFPLRRMTGRGQTAARRVVDALAAIELRRDATPAKNDALKKAAKVLEDRRQKNPVAKIILLTNGHEDHRLSSSRFPVHSLRYYRDGACGHVQQDSEFSNRVESLLSVVAQDLRLELKPASRSATAEIIAVYSLAKCFTAALSPDSAVMGDMYAAEERELMVELKVPAGTASRGSHHHFISVRSSHRDPFTQELVHSKEREFVFPRPHTVRSSNPMIERLRCLHVSARAVAESRRLVARNDVSGALHLVASARASMMQSSQEHGGDCLRWLEAEQAELRCQKPMRSNNSVEEKVEPLTPMSAWRVAERLAKVAIMRKSMNRVSDLHGFEDARF